ncbi:hypothetical protein [Agarilytica rhodophyticola]|uniref:hypothetical protein n=1 Tax=Agarilytica rhodophyticola TaxID=1737490 RepID=UPI000B348993|nr:hypothetical protein [Agarilytica rhodophyticola]
MKILVTLILLLGSFSSLAQAVSYDRDFFVEVTSTTNENTGTVTEKMFGTLAYERAHEENSFTAVSTTSNGYIYFLARDKGINFSCFVHESVKSPSEMENFRTIAAAFNNGSRILVTKFGHLDYCSGASLHKNSWQHLN